MTMMPAGAGGEPFRVFLKHLFMSTTESQLRGELSKLDADEGLQQVHLVKRGRFDNTRTINGFLTYNTKAQVDKAVDLLQGQIWADCASIQQRWIRPIPETSLGGTMMQT